MVVAELPDGAAWRHVGARDGFEVAFFRAEADGYVLDGQTCAVEDGVAWAVHYRVLVDAAWGTRGARVTSRSAAGERAVAIDRASDGGWLVDAVPVRELTGCLDVDLEASVVTNTVPVHRLGLDAGASAQAPAVFVRADLTVERLDQRYCRVSDDEAGQAYDYEAPRFGYRGRLEYDASGLLLRYPGLAERVL
ncbi:MAG TPA: putative glycolipid-binding domain-containing protein [Kineosporiaceae bacterium]|nr:putative glycolipid-binding domain-containing protein [Kineosporiaceae bacterium]